MRTLLCALLITVLFLPAAAWAADAGSSVSRLVIFPNDKPTIVPSSTDQQFTVTAYDASDVMIGEVTVMWSVGGGIGSIDNEGIFTAEHGGIGTVTATYGTLSATVGVVVSDNKPQQDAPAVNTSSPTPVPPASTNVVPVPSTNENTNTKGTVDVPSIEPAPASTPQEEATCTTIRAWVWIFIVFAFVVLTFMYYLALGESITMWWWAVPLAGTAGVIGIHLWVRCGSLHQWVPWTLGALGVLIALFYVRVLRPRRDEHTPSAQ